MKKLISFLSAISYFLFNVAQADSCTYTLEMHDSWGDGWNGSEIKISTNSNASIFGLSDGADSSIIFDVISGQILELEWLGGGTWDSEISINLLNSIGDTIFTQPAPPTIGLLLYDTVSCLSNPSLVEVKTTSLSIYPNPNNGCFFIANSDNEDTIEVSVFNIQGKSVYNSTFNLSSGKTKLIFLNELNSGMYLMLINTKKGSSYHNIIIK